MAQENHSGTNYQTQTGQNNTNFFGGEHNHYYLSPQSPLINCSSEQIQEATALFVEQNLKVAQQRNSVLSPPQFRSFRFNYATVEQQAKMGGLIRRPVLIHHSGQAKYFDEDLGGGIDLRMVQVPGSTFQIGASDDETSASNCERPQRSIAIQSFCMGKYPVTQTQWRAIARLASIMHSLPENPSRFTGAEHPVENISWEEAIEFCLRLSVKTGRNYRLPTEAEWEYACRAGTSTPFHFGEILTPDVANYRNHDADKQTCPVGSFKIANSFGLYDMHGNVWEWCMDHWHNSHRSTPQDGSAWRSNKSNQSCIIRGGSWADLSATCRSSCRKSARQNERGSSIGFRIVCSLVEIK